MGFADTFRDFYDSMTFSNELHAEAPEKDSKEEGGEEGGEEKGEDSREEGEGEGEDKDGDEGESKDEGGEEEGGEDKEEEEEEEEDDEPVDPKPQIEAGRSHITSFSLQNNPQRHRAAPGFSRDISVSTFSAIHTSTPHSHCFLTNKILHTNIPLSQHDKLIAPKKQSAPNPPNAPPSSTTTTNAPSASTARKRTQTTRVPRRIVSKNV